MKKVMNFVKKNVAKAAVFGAVVEGRAQTLCCSDAFDMATTASTNLQAKLVSLAGSLFPLALIICAISMFFTQDQKKFDLEKHILIGICGAYALIILVTKGAIVTTITNLFN